MDSKPMPKAGQTPALPGNDAPDSMDGDEDCIPLASLAMPDPDNGDQMANPEVGDKVNYQIEGTVTRIEGDNAYVKRESVNGQPIAEEADESTVQSPQSGDLENLRGQAEQMDKEGSYP